MVSPGLVVIIVTFAMAIEWFIMSLLHLRERRIWDDKLADAIVRHASKLHRLSLIIGELRRGTSGFRDMLESVDAEIESEMKITGDPIE